MNPDGSGDIVKIPLPEGPERLRSYFAGVSAMNPGQPQWTNGVMMCDWWLRLCTAASVTQIDIDLFIRRLDEEKHKGSGWIDLDLQFKHWARGRGFVV